MEYQNFYFFIFKDKAWKIIRPLRDALYMKILFKKNPFKKI